MSLSPYQKGYIDGLNHSKVLLNNVLKSMQDRRTKLQYWGPYIFGAFIFVFVFWLMRLMR